MAKAAKKLTKTVAKAAPQKTAPKVHKQKLSRPAANEESDMEPQGEAEQNEDEEEEEEEASSEEGGEPASKGDSEPTAEELANVEKELAEQEAEEKEKKKRNLPSTSAKDVLSGYMEQLSHIP